MGIKKSIATPIPIKPSVAPLVANVICFPGPSPSRTSDGNWTPAHSPWRHLRGCTSQLVSFYIAILTSSITLWLLVLHLKSAVCCASSTHRVCVTGCNLQCLQDLHSSRRVMEAGKKQTVWIRPLWQFFPSLIKLINMTNGLHWLPLYMFSLIF